MLVVGLASCMDDVDSPPRSANSAPSSAPAPSGAAVPSRTEADVYAALFDRLVDDWGNANTWGQEIREFHVRDRCQEAGAWKLWKHPTFTGTFSATRAEETFRRGAHPIDLSSVPSIAPVRMLDATTAARLEDALPGDDRPRFWREHPHSLGLVAVSDVLLDLTGTKAIVWFTVDPPGACSAAYLGLLVQREGRWHVVHADTCWIT